MSKALYRKYRSKKLSEIVGQDHVTDILSRSLEKGIVSHAYLLTGPRGVGKTSIARILAHEINNLAYDDESTHLDIIEIDAASNNGVEDIRDLRDKVQLAPVAAERKIYIIDEVHMLSKPAFNALLKTLEEPPAHIVFILATTDADKLPATIISRTQQFTFRSINRLDAISHLKDIAKKEHISIDDAALELIADHGDGSFRDSIGLLDQLRSLSGKDTVISSELVEKVLGLAPHTLISQLVEAYEKKQLETIVKLLHDCENRGLSAAVLSRQMIASIRAVVVEKPQLITLLDELLEVGKSTQPHIKLLTTLAIGAVPAPKTVALDSPAKTLESPLVELKRQATKVHPKMAPIKTGQSAAEKKVSAKKTVEPTVQSAASPPKEPVEFDWDKLVAETRSHFVAVYSVLSKCDYDFDGNVLTIYTKNTFYKKKLDDPKHRVNLSKALEVIGAEALSIETIPSTRPPRDSQAAAIAAIMGGGEEVSVE